jgi:heat shock protein HslJ
MNKLTSNKSIILTIAAALLLILTMNVFSTNKKVTNTSNTNQGGPFIQPSPEIREDKFRAIVPSLMFGRQVLSLELTGQDAKLTTFNLTDNNTKVQSGSFAKAGEFITVLLVDENGEAMQVPTEYLLNSSDAGLRLVDPISEGFDSADIIFEKNATSLVQTSWYWTETQLADGTLVEPSDKKKFKLVFKSDSEVSTTTDCNNGSGNYYNTPNLILFTPMATTKKYCNGSLENTYLGYLVEVESYIVKGSNLILMLPYDSGSMVFEKAED